MDNKKFQKSSKKYFCKCCDYLTSRKSQYERHILTAKHARIIMDNKMDNMDNRKVPLHFQCNCGKSYKYMSGLSKHKYSCKFLMKEPNEIIKYTKNCDDKKNTNINEITNLTNLVLEVVKSSNEMQKQNNNLQNQILELCKNGTNITNNINNSNNNSNNKTFNLQFFLNETCKNAMNIMDFVNSVKLQVSDLENVGKLGFVEGISNIIVKNLNNLDITQRPVHCTDSKREVMYIKDEDKWFNDTKEEENKKLKKAIKHIVNKNVKLLPEFKATYPDCIYSDSQKSDQYNKLVIEAYGGKNDDIINENKIISNIVKETGINKDLFST